MIYIASKRSKLENIQKRFPNAIICDVTSTSNNSLVKLSPFYPHGNIPVPFSQGVFGVSVEGIWQGLKVFENEDIDLSYLNNTSMKGIKRTCRKHGRVLGHRKGVGGKEILGYQSAKFEIYIPTYKWVLENKVSSIIDRMREVVDKNDIVLLDYNTSENVMDETKSLSHAYLIKAYLLGLVPYGKKQSLKETTLFDYEEE